MCGRFALNATGRDIVDFFQLDLLPMFRLTSDAPLRAFTPRFNVAPTQFHPIVTADEDGNRTATAARWGLIPKWSRDKKIAARMINARSESVFEKATWRTPVRKQRCLVPANGFYEWAKVPVPGRKQPKKQPYLIRIEDGRLFAFAGIFETWLDKSEDEDSDLRELTTFSILTTGANDTVSSIHDRMPVVLRQADHDLWLEPDLDDEEIAELLQPSGLPWVLTAVGPDVGKVGIDDERCWAPPEA